ncbi:MAG: hypothetical protein ACJ8G4_02375 [Burkholderiales bacterium]
MRKNVARARDLGLTPAEFAVLKRLDTPHKIQEFVSSLRSNFEVGGQTCLSVREVLKQRRAHCIEGAMLAACAFWVHGEPPLLLDMRAVHDFDHVVALYRRHGLWGAISKTNGIFLRSRDPVYRDLRELAMSYFHEYANRRNDKTLREYSVPYDLRRMDPRVWVSGESGAWPVATALDHIRHFRLVEGRHLRLVSRRDPFERRASALSQYRTPRVLIEKEKLLKAKRALAARKRAKNRR